MKLHDHFTFSAMNFSKVAFTLHRNNELSAPEQAIGYVGVPPVVPNTGTYNSRISNFNVLVKFNSGTQLR